MPDYLVSSISVKRLRVNAGCFLRSSHPGPYYEVRFMDVNGYSQVITICRDDLLNLSKAIEPFLEVPDVPGD